MRVLFPSDWLADAPYEDRDLGVLKAGKESEVYLVSRCGPTRTCLMAEKRGSTGAFAMTISTSACGAKGRATKIVR